MWEGFIYVSPELIMVVAARSFPLHFLFSVCFNGFLVDRSCGDSLRGQSSVPADQQRLQGRNHGQGVPLRTCRILDRAQLCSHEITRSQMNGPPHVPLVGPRHGDRGSTFISGDMVPRRGIDTALAAKSGELILDIPWLDMC